MTTQRMLRAVIHFAFCFVLILGALVSMFGQPQWADKQEALAAERRFASLEGSVASLVRDMHDLKDRGRWDWIQQICLALLVGERGTDVLRRKRRQDDEEG